MKKNDNKGSCVLGIAPSSRGIGYAVVAQNNVLIDWGVNPVKSGNKNERCLSHAAKLIETYQPAIVSLEKCLKNSRRSDRIKALIDEIADVARDGESEVRRFSRKQVNLEILHNDDGTKLKIAENLAERYPKQLSFRLPKKRRLWTSEAYQMDIFDALALAECAVN